MSDLHVIFGSGQVGYLLAERLASLGHRGCASSSARPAVRRVAAT